MFKDRYNSYMKEQSVPDSLIERTMNQAARKDPSKMHSKRFHYRFASSFLVFALVLAIGGGAAMASKVMTGEWLGLFVNTQNEPSLADEMRTNINQSVRLDQYKLTLDSAYSDDFTTKCYFILETLDGAPLLSSEMKSKGYSNDDIVVAIDVVTPGNKNTILFPATIVENSSENQIGIVVSGVIDQFSDVGNATSQVMLYVSQINAYSKSDPTQYITLFESNKSDETPDFNFEITKNYSSTQYILDNEFELEISPMSMSIVKGDAAVKDTSYSMSMTFDDSINVTITLNDGSIIEMTKILRTEAVAETGETCIWYTAAFSMVVDPDNVKSVMFSGTNYNIK